MLKRAREYTDPVLLEGKMASVTETDCMAAAAVQVASDQSRESMHSGIWITIGSTCRPVMVATRLGVSEAED